MEARLILEDGSEFVGKSFGSARDAIGEVVFHTGMTGYQEVLSDPACYGQLVTMAYPLIGNYGLTREDFESVRPHLFGLIVREYEPVPSNWRARYSLDEWLKRHDIPGISEIDTRMLVRKIREHGSMKGLLTVSKDPVDQLLAKLKQAEPVSGPVARVSTAHMYHAPGSGNRIVLIDLGVKNGILRELIRRELDVVVVPYRTSAAEIHALAPDGILLAGGPGDPKELADTVDTVRELLEHYPFFGIGLGHLLFALACGADTVKMKYGHHGNSYPVKDLKSGRCLITPQNHMYTISEHSLEKSDLEVSYINNNDGTIEGLRHKHLPAFSVQFHPEASPGSTDAQFLFDEFLDMIERFRAEHPAEPRQAVFAREAATRKGVLQYAEK